MVKVMKMVSVLALAAAILLVTVANIQVAEGVTCSLSELSPCAAAFSSYYSPPSWTCCSKLREQRSCLCGYMRNPNLRPYVSSPNARNVANTCKIAFPNC